MATNISHTVETILQIISDLRGESSTNTDANRIRAVSRANQDFARRKLWKFYLLLDQTQTGDATNEYTIGSATNPMRYKGLTEVFVDSAGATEESDRIRILDYNVAKQTYNSSNTYRFVYEWYDSANNAWKMHINPAPKATETITYSFYWEPPTLTATTDTVICPNPKIIALLALSQLHDGEDEKDLGIQEKNEAEMLIGEIIGLDNSPAVNQTYSVGTVSNPSGNSGYGTY